jgi:hypothetical protein
MRAVIEHDLQARDTDDCDAPASRATSIDDADLGILKALFVSFLTPAPLYD